MVRLLQSLQIYKGGIATMSGEVLRFPVKVYLGDTNMEGNTYWENFCKWLGNAREELLLTILSQIEPSKAVPDYVKLFKEGRLPIGTHETNLKNHHSVFFGDIVDVEVRIAEVKLTSVKLSFDFINDGKKIAEAWQEVFFMDANGKPVKIPKEILSIAEKYLVMPH